MIIKTSLVAAKFDAFTLYPFIFIRPEKAEDTALIAHELVHYAEQREAWVIPWLLRYIFSKKFRFYAEIRAYQVQLAMGGITLDQVVDLLGQYGFNLSREDYLRELAG